MSPAVCSLGITILLEHVAQMNLERNERRTVPVQARCCHIDMGFYRPTNMEADCTWKTIFLLKRPSLSFHRLR